MPKIINLLHSNKIKINKHGENKMTSKNKGSSLFGPVLVAAFMAFWGYVGGIQHGRELERASIVETPISIEQKDMNNDGLEDRVFTIKKGCQQIQYQFKADNSIKYWTEGQIQEYKTNHPVQSRKAVTVRNSVDNLDYKINTGEYILTN
jgi:hypothetical protein